MFGQNVVFNILLVHYIFFPSDFSRFFHCKHLLIRRLCFLILSICLILYLAPVSAYIYIYIYKFFGRIFDGSISFHLLKVCFPLTPKNLLSIFIQLSRFHHKKRNEKHRFVFLLEWVLLSGWSRYKGMRWEWKGIYTI